MQTELRILNGLHRGGVLPLDESTLLIGAHEDADVVLVDPDILAHHASLQKTDSGWVITADAGPVFGTEHPSAQMLLDLQSGDFFRLGETWLVICDARAAWQAVPQAAIDHESIEKSRFDAIESMHAAGSQDRFDTDEAQFFAQEVSDHAAALAAQGSSTADDVQDDSSGAQAAIAADGSDESGIKPGARPSRGGALAARVRQLFSFPRWRKWMIAPVSLCALLSAVAAYAYTAKPSLPKLAQAETSADWRIAKSDDSLSATDKSSLAARRDATSSSRLELTTAAATSNASAAVVTPVSVAPSVPSVPTGPIALQPLFRKRMKEADLLQRFDLDLSESAWSMRAHLDDEEGARFERILKAFVAEHKITFPISAKVGSAESMLPFQIKQIVTGANAGIVTGDGDRLYVGDELLGVKLMAVVDNHLTFMGKRKIEVIW